MDIYFYNNHSPANVVRKKLDNETVISGTLKEDIEIINPELLISKQVFTFNYCYIPKFKRYYYIKNQMLETKNFIRLYLHVDVLMSYQNIIRNSTAQIQVSSSKGNGYYNTSPSYDVRTKYREKLYYNNPFNKDGVNVLLAIKTQ